MQNLKNIITVYISVLFVKSNQTQHVAHKETLKIKSILFSFKQNTKPILFWGEMHSYI